ncbi:hypothetical protein QA646_00450 [Rhizobium sp. CB3090]|nr:hypothetical protein [Rhizobium sp. CB3090]WFU09375.1 hypothetical protein QA646_00450 [Rhizobium sp. CB3090]
MLNWTAKDIPSQAGRTLPTLLAATPPEAEGGFMYGLDGFVN